MTADGYFQSAIPEPFRILGLELKPLSLGRYRLLKRHDCAFVADGPRNASTLDLIIGVLICSMRVDEFQEFMRSPEFGEQTKSWWHQALASSVDFNILEKIALFQRYIKTHSAFPDYWDESESSQCSGAHWAFSLAVTLKSELKWTEEEINEEPLCKALFEYFKWAESQGSIQLMTQSDIEEGKKNVITH